MELQEKLYKPVQAIIVHRSGSDYYLESCKINDDLSFGATHPLMKKTVVDIIDDMSVDVTDRLQFKGPIPKNIITVRNSPGNTLVAWITRPQKVRMYFTKNVDLKDITAPVPALLWVAQNNKLKLFAMKGHRISLKTKNPLCIAPFSNTYEDGGVCWGSSKWPNDTIYYEDYIKGIEIGFWKSRFSHNMKGVKNKSKTDLHQLWEMLDGTEKFPNGELLESQANGNIKKLLGYEK